MEILTDSASHSPKIIFSLNKTVVLNTGLRDQMCVYIDTHSLLPEMDWGKDKGNDIRQNKGTWSKVIIN